MRGGRNRKTNVQKLQKLFRVDHGLVKLSIDSSKVVEGSRELGQVRDEDDELGGLALALDDSVGDEERPEEKSDGDDKIPMPVRKT